MEVMGNSVVCEFYDPRSVSSRSDEFKWGRICHMSDYLRLHADTSKSIRIVYCIHTYTYKHAQTYTQADMYIRSVLCGRRPI